MANRTESEIPDSDLVAAVRAGDPAALGLLYDRYSRSVFRTAVRLTRSETDAEDIVQDVFVGLPATLEGYEERGRFPSWIRSVTVNAVRAARRSGERRRARQAVAADLDRSGVHPIDHLTIRDAIARLTEGQRAVFLLKEVEGYSHSEIAQQLGISPNASALRNHRAWRELERLVRKTGGEAPND